MVCNKTFNFRFTFMLRLLLILKVQISNLLYEILYLTEICQLKRA